MFTNVEYDFKWPLDNGVEIIVEAGGMFDGESIFPLELGFITNPAPESKACEILKAIQSEIGRIEEYAVMILCEKARAVLNERSAS